MEGRLHCSEGLRLRAECIPSVAVSFAEVPACPLLTRDGADLVPKWDVWFKLNGILMTKLHFQSGHVLFSIGSGLSVSRREMLTLRKMLACAVIAAGTPIWAN